jgi:hypothetical protein
MNRSITQESPIEAVLNRQLLVIRAGGTGGRTKSRQNDGQEYMISLFFTPFGESVFPSSS